MATAWTDGTVYNDCLWHSWKITTPAFKDQVLMKCPTSDGDAMILLTVLYFSFHFEVASLPHHPGSQQLCSTDIRPCQRIGTHAVEI